MITQRIDKAVDILKTRGWQRGGSNFAGDKVCIGQAASLADCLAEFKEWFNSTYDQNFIRYNDSKIRNQQHAIAILNQFREHVAILERV